jgi:hypothetical protein
MILRIVAWLTATGVLAGVLAMDRAPADPVPREMSATSGATSDAATIVLSTFSPRLTWESGGRCTGSSSRRERTKIPSSATSTSRPPG